MTRVANRDQRIEKHFESIREWMHHSRVTGRPNGQRRSCLQCACRAINDGFSSEMRAWGCWHTCGPPASASIALVLAGSSTDRDAETLATDESDFEESWGYSIYASVIWHVKAAGAVCFLNRMFRNPMQPNLNRRSCWAACAHVQRHSLYKHVAAAQK